MRIHRRPGWRIAEPAATPEQVYRDRRRLLAALGFGAAGALLRGAAGALAEAPPPAIAPSPGTPEPARPAPGYPARRDTRFTLDRPVTAESLAGSHNIFDEFSSARDGVAAAAARFRTDPWRVHVGGQVQAARSFDVLDLARSIGLEERLYRHRCVETWAMAVPWTGFPLARLIERCEPLGKARFVRFVSVARPEEMPGWYASRRVFPYYEALTLAEATNELAFVATGIYGHPLPPQHGAPLRLVLPWKYGFKSAKSIVALQFTAERPGTFWNDLAPDKYSWASNVDPAETHPWPQARETMLGDEESRPTLPWNGYGEWVAALYA